LGIGKLDVLTMEQKKGTPTVYFCIQLMPNIYVLELQSYANMCFWDVLVVIGMVGEMRLHGKMEAPPKP
jgi:hypothetical protein